MQFDAERAMAFGAISGVQFGGKYRARLRDCYTRYGRSLMIGMRAVY